MIGLVFRARYKQKKQMIEFMQVRISADDIRMIIRQREQVIRFLSKEMHRTVYLEVI